MKNKMLIAAMLFVMSLFIIQPVYAAYTAVSGTVIDSVTFTPWLHGADVVVLNMSTPECIGSGSVSTVDGTFSITYGTDGLALGSCANAGAGDFDTIRVIIDYNCAYSGGGNCTGGNTGGTPAPNEIEYTNFGSGTKSLQNIQTGTSPTAITMQSFTAGGTDSGLPLLITIIILALTGFTIIVVRRRYVKRSAV